MKRGLVNWWTHQKKILIEAQGDKRIQKEYFGYRERFSTIVIEVPGEGREKEGKREWNRSNIWIDNGQEFPKLMKNTNSHIQKAL